MLIELHDNVVPGVTAVIKERLPGHTQSRQSDLAKRMVASVDLSFLTPNEAAKAVLENRPPQEWFLLSPPCREYFAFGQETSRSE